MCRHDTRTTAASPGLEKTDLRADRRFRVVTPAPKRDAAPAEWIGVGVPEAGALLAGVGEGHSVRTGSIKGQPEESDGRGLPRFSCHPDPDRCERWSSSR